MQIDKGKASSILIVCLVVLFSILWVSIGGRYKEDSIKMVAGKAILQSLGASSLALSYECTATRSLTEGLCGCLSDVPGGYCYHSSCDIVVNPGIPEAEVLRLEVIK